jgi:Inner membrane protein YgaP-like, transmembrane domain
MITPTGEKTMTTQTLASPDGGSSTIDQWVFRVAGLFVLASLALSQVHSANWLWFTAFVGANMLQASFTGFCPLAMILQKLGISPGAAFCPRASRG